MVARMLSAVSVTALVFSAPSGGIVRADEPTGAPVAADSVTDVFSLLPETTVAVLHIADPPRLVSAVFDHPLRHRIEELDVWQQAVQQQGYRNFLTMRKLAEIQLGMEWREALETLPAQGVTLAVDGARQAPVVLVRAPDAATMELLRVKLLQLTQLAGQSGVAGEYRGVTAYKVGKAATAVVGEWLVVTADGDLGKQMIDRLLDGPSADKRIRNNPRFAEALSERSEDAAAWGWLDVSTVREAGVAEKLYSGRAENPAAELLIGGLLSTLQHTPWAAAELFTETDEWSLSVRMPHDDAWVPEEREYFFGPEGTGRAAALPELPETLLTVGMHRDASEMWLRAGDLFDQRTNDQLAEADANLTTLFAGRDFGEEILGSVSPQLSLIAVRQDRSGKLPTPSIRLPAFALVLQLREPDVMARELRRTFQSMIGFFNVIGAMQGNPQLELDMEKQADGGELVISRFLPEDSERDSANARIHFNFSPSIGIDGDRFVVSSTEELVRQLMEAAEPQAAAEPANTDVLLNGSVLRDVLTDNEEHLIAQNMLQEGRSREEASAAIGLLLEGIGWVQDGSLRMSVEDSRIQIRGAVRLRLPEEGVRENLK